MPVPNYVIGGRVDFGQAPGLGNLSDPQSIGNSYQSAYQQALNTQGQNYQNVLAGYQQTMNEQVGRQHEIGAGYGRLMDQTLGQINGVDQSQRQAIADSYAQQSGGLAQQLTNSGLGNTTVAGSMQRGLQFDRQKADIALSNQMAQLRAGYTANLGQSWLNSANQANVQNTALANQQLTAMERAGSVAYPNLAAYGSLATHAASMGEQRRQYDLSHAEQVRQYNLSRQTQGDQFNRSLDLQRQLGASRGGGGGGGGGRGPGNSAPQDSTSFGHGGNMPPSPYAQAGQDYGFSSPYSSLASAFRPGTASPYGGSAGGSVGYGTGGPAQVAFERAWYGDPAAGGSPQDDPYADAADPGGMGGGGVF